MKHIIVLVLMLTFGNLFSQNKNDYSEIIELVIAEYKSDTIKVYKRFQNQRLLTELERVKMQHDSKVYETYEQLKDSAKPDANFEQKFNALYSDSVIVTLEKIKIKFFPSLEWVEKKDKDRIKPYYKADFEKRRKNRPIAFISMPLISIDNKKAIVFDSYICGGLCGSGGVFFLEKINGVWKIIDYEIRWVA